LTDKETDCFMVKTMSLVSKNKFKGLGFGGFAAET
jgi:hypothetical protein